MFISICVSCHPVTISFMMMPERYIHIIIGLFISRTKINKSEEKICKTENSIHQNPAYWRNYLLDYECVSRDVLRGVFSAVSLGKIHSSNFIRLIQILTHRLFCFSSGHIYTRNPLPLIGKCICLSKHRKKNRKPNERQRERKTPNNLNNKYTPRRTNKT